MESITIKVENTLAKEIDKAMTPYYSTKTEFIREAIREKLRKLEKERALDEVKKYFGRSSKKTSAAEERKIREETGKEIAKAFGITLE